MPAPPHLHSSGLMLGSTPARLMLITTRLAVDGAGCVHSASYGTEDGTVGLVWPDDYGVRTGERGTFEIVDADGQVVAREGDTITAGGGFGEDPPPSDCAARHAEYLWIETPVRTSDGD